MRSAQSINAELSECDQSQGWPVVEQVTAHESDQTLVELELSVPTGLPTFAGHFPSQAVVPGILQIHWAAQLAQLCFSQLEEPPMAAQFTELKGIKFNAMVLPKAELVLTLKFHAAKLNFSYTSERLKHSNGMLLFAGNST